MYMLKSITLLNLCYTLLQILHITIFIPVFSNSFIIISLTSRQIKPSKPHAILGIAIFLMPFLKASNFMYAKLSAQNSM